MDWTKHEKERLEMLESQRDKLLAAAKEEPPTKLAERHKLQSEFDSLQIDILKAAHRIQVAANKVHEDRFIEIIGEDPKQACEQCGEEFEPRRPSARFCSTKCRVAAHRDRNPQTRRSGRFKRSRNRSMMRPSFI